MHSIRPKLVRLALALGLCSLPGAAGAADFHVDVTTGIDDVGMADGSVAQPWRTVTFALAQIPAAGTHVLRLAAGEYSEAAGELLPFRLPVNLSLEGDAAGGTVIVDTRSFSAPTIFWQVRGPDVLGSGSALRNLTIERRVPGPYAGRAVALIARSTTASPTLENLTIHGAEAGLDFLADAELGPALLAPVLTNVVLTGNQIGILGTAYTYRGDDSAVDPVITNSVLSDNVHGAVFETSAAYGLATGQRRRATSAPVVTHCTLAGNTGSSLVLDDTNVGLGAAGPITPAVRNSILSAADGDYTIEEFSATSFPSALDDNLLEASPLGFYLDNGLTDLLTIAEVNALATANRNVEGTPLFVRDVVPNWRLRADSPGVDAAPASALAVDFEGDGRPSDSDGDGTAAPELGADEVPNCAVSVVLVPDAPEDRCGVFGPLDFDASGSGITPGFPACGGPLRFQWFRDAEPLVGETFPTLSVTPDVSAVYSVKVWCPDDPQCSDTATAPVTVYELPTADAGIGWSACLPADEDRVTLDLMGTATAPEGAAIDGWEWTTTNPFAAILGGATPTPLLEIAGYTDFAHLPVELTLTVTDSNGCTATDTTIVDIWRAPRVTVNGPYVICMQEGGQTALPVSATVELPAGSAAVAWDWQTSVGSFDDAAAEAPSLIRNNLSFTITSQVSVTVTDDHGCSATSPLELATFHPSPSSNPGGPYQLQEDPSGTTSFTLDGSGSRGGTGALSHLWTTDLGSFVPPSADLPVVQLDILNTGVDQIANVCLLVSDENACPRETCTVVSVKASPLQPPNDVGGTFRIAKFVSEALMIWTNAPLDATHDLADRYDVWETPNPLPDLGGWTIRVSDVMPRPGVSIWQESALLDLAGPDLLYLKVVARNAAGNSCVTPPAPRPTLDPDCAP